MLFSALFLFIFPIESLRFLLSLAIDIDWVKFCYSLFYIHSFCRFRFYFIFLFLLAMCTHKMNPIRAFFLAAEILWKWATHAEQKLIRINVIEWRRKSFAFVGKEKLSAHPTEPKSNYRQRSMNRRYFVINEFFSANAGRLISIGLGLSFAITFAMNGRRRNNASLLLIRRCDIDFSFYDTFTRTKSTSSSWTSLSICRLISICREQTLTA